MKGKGTLRVCKNGHSYYKSSDCPTCPVCEQQHQPADGFLSLISAPAWRAMEHEGIKTLTQLSKRSEAEILALHGIGPGSMKQLRKSLEAEGLSFKK
ncbi:MAG TPA: RNA polymerase alpha subunit C-terminal domain-containing protein [Cyclobacteriaceae bacterium]